MSVSLYFLRLQHIFFLGCILFTEAVSLFERQMFHWESDAELKTTCDLPPAADLLSTAALPQDKLVFVPNWDQHGNLIISSCSRPELCRMFCHNNIFLKNREPKEK